MPRCNCIPRTPSTEAVALTVARPTAVFALIQTDARGGLGGRPALSPGAGLAWATAMADTDARLHLLQDCGGRGPVRYRPRLDAPAGLQLTLFQQLGAE